MVGGGESMVMASMWASMANWFTPSVLFCVLNVTIATIYIASNFTSPDDHHVHQQNLPGQLARSPSLLERVKSVNLSSFYTTPESQHQYPVHSETTGYNPVSPLSRTPSFLERVKSIDFSFSSFSATPSDQLHLHPDDHDYQTRPESEQTHYDSPPQLARSPSLLERVKSINFSSFYNYNQFPTESEQPNDSPGELVRSPSFLDRVRSFKVPSPFNSDHQSGDTFSGEHQHAEPADPNPDYDPAPDHRMTSCKSKSFGVTRAKNSLGNIRKSRSESGVPASDDSEEDVYRGRPATMKASIGTKDENVDAKADDFINRFKQQLKLQRLESLKRFKEMLNRGTTSA